MRAFFGLVLSFTVLVAVSGCHRGGDAPLTIAVSPDHSDFVPNAQIQFTALVSGSLDGRVSWSLEGPGRIDATTGLYEAPTRLPKDSENMIQIAATSVRKPSRVGLFEFALSMPPIEPRRGMSADATRVEISGTHLDQGTIEILFGGQPGTNIEIVNEGTLARVTTPIFGKPGSVDVEVKRDGERIAFFPRSFHIAASSLEWSAGRFSATCSGAFGAIPMRIDTDLRVDLAAICDDGRIALMRRADDHLLETSVRYRSSYSYVDGIVAGDLDADGDDDLLVYSTSGVNALGVLENANGFLRQVGELAYAESSISGDSVGLADMNGDGRADVVAGDWSSFSIIVWLSQPNWKFSEPRVATLPDFSPSLAAIGDVNGDGNPDVVSVDGNSSPNLTTWAGDGAGSLLSPRILQTDLLTAEVGTLSLGDFNGDARLDIAIGQVDGLTQSLLHIYYQDAENTFQAPVAVLSGDEIGLGVSFYKGTLRAADVDGDGFTDLTSADELGRTRVWFGSSAGIDPFAYPHLQPIDPLATDILALDNPDDTTTLVSIIDNAAGVARVGIPSPRTSEGSTLIDVASVPGGHAWLDANRSRMGWAARSLTGGWVYVLNMKDETYARIELPGGARPTGLQSADINGDGDLDLVAFDTVETNPGAGRAWVLETRDGALQPPITYSFPRALFDANLGDVDGDGKIDMIVTMQRGAEPSSEVVVLWGQERRPAGPKTVASAAAALHDPTPTLGKGLFAPFENAERADAGDEPRALEIRDLNDDGRPEILTADYQGSQLIVLAVSTSRNIEQRAALTTTMRPSRILVEDVDGDYRTDLLVAAQAGATVVIDVLKGMTEPFTFELAASYPGNVGAIESVSYGDVDGDALGDVVVSHSFFSGTSIFRGQDGGRLSYAELTASAEVASGGATLVDIDGDGMLDLLTGDELYQPNMQLPTGATGGLRILRNRSR